MRTSGVVLVLVLGAALVACGGSSPAAPTPASASPTGATGAWEKIYDHPAASATAIEMYDDEFGLAIIGHGIERTTDGGKTWHETDSADDFIGPIAIADRDRAWVVGAGGAMLRTTDGGMTWTQQKTDTKAPLASVSAVSADEAWVAGYDAAIQGFPPHGESALQHTVDGGATWQSVDVPGYGIFIGVWFVGGDGWLLATQCHPGDPLDDPNAEPGTPGHAPCTDRQTMLHTPDDGGSWEVLRMSADVPVFVDRIDAQRAFASFQCSASGCSGLVRFYTSDGGRTWVPAEATGETGAPTDIVKPGGASGVLVYDSATSKWDQASTDAGPELTRVTFTTGDEGYATTDDGNLWITNDGGATWSPVADGRRWEIAATGLLWSIDSDRTMHLSDDGGETQRKVAPPPGSQTSATFNVAAADGDHVWVVLIDGLWRTDDAGETWMRVDGTGNAQYHFIDPQHAWVSPCNAACDEPYRFTSDGGQTWDERPVPQSVYPGFVFATPLDGWASPYNPDADCHCLLVTHDGGLTWRTVSTGTWSLTQLVPVDAERAFAVGVTSLSLDVPPDVIATSDGGATWHKEFSLEGYAQTHFVARDGRIWLYLSTSRVNGVDGGYDPPRRTIVYRREIEAAAPSASP